MPAETGTLLLKAIDAALPESEPVADCEDQLHVSAETSARPPSLSMRRADAATLRDHAAGCCEFEDGPAVAAETARRLACDASRVEITEDERGDPLDVGRHTRTIPPALRRALRARDKGCFSPGCTHKHFVDGHHLVHWANGGATKLSNLVLLCRLYHRAVHEGGLHVERCNDDAWRFFRPTGEAIDSRMPGKGLPLTQWTTTLAGNAERGVHIDERTGASNWRGEEFDCSIAVDAMLFRQRAAAAATCARG